MSILTCRYVVWHVAIAPGVKLLGIRSLLTNYFSPLSSHPLFYYSPRPQVGISSALSCLALKFCSMFLPAYHFHINEVFK